jgi:hypothetical protein
MCNKCLYDNISIPSITFDSEGICNYCKMQENIQEEYTGGIQGENEFKKIVEKIKKDGRKKKYDCVVGVSGGCDSSYLVYIAKKYGLRPIAVHFDNTWNSTTATENIKNVLNKLDVDLYTYVVSNKEYDDIYRSFLKAGVQDVDVPTDLGLAEVLNRAAEKYGVKYVLEGHNFRSEGVAPLDWVYMDGKYIETVHKTFGSLKMETFPNMSFRSFLKWMLLKRIRKIRPLW